MNVVDCDYIDHAARQKIAARLAFDDLPVRSRKAMERRECEPAGLDREGRPLPDLPDAAWGRKWFPLENQPEPVAPDLDDERPELVVDVEVWWIIDLVIDALTEGERDRPAAIAAALKACVRGEHPGESAAEIAKAHCAPISPVRRYRVGLRSRGLI